MINEYMKYPPGTPLKVYEEIKPTMIEAMKQKATFLQAEIQDGDIVCFQTELSEQSIDVDKQTKFTSPIQIYDFFLNRVLIRFRPRYEEEPKLPQFDLMLSKKMSYDQMAAKVGEALRHDYTKLRFTTSNVQTGMPKAPIRRHNAHTVAEMIQPSYQQTPNNLLFYELLDMSLVELETKRNVRITWMGLYNKEEGTHAFLLPKASSIHDVIETLKQTVKLMPDGSDRIRIFEISQGRRMKIFSEFDYLKEFNEQSELYAEEIPIDELNVDEAEDKIIGAYHFQKDPTRTHGVPFRFVVKPKEQFIDTKKRLQARMGASDKDFGKMKFALVQPAVYSKPSYLSDDDLLRDHKWQDEDLLGIDHIDKTPKRTGMERAVVIR